MDVTILLILAVAGVAFLLLVLWLLGSLLKKVPPDQALITYGCGGTSVVTGGAAWVWPIFQRSATFSLELMSFAVAPQQDLYSNQGVAVNVEAVTQLKVKSDQESIITAAEQVLSKTWDERQALIRLAMEGHLRGVMGQLTIEQLVKEPEMVSEKMRQMSSSDLAKMGLDEARQVRASHVRKVERYRTWLRHQGASRDTAAEQVVRLLAKESQHGLAP